jgi:Spy/CpxP family protein refolding chaperone
MFRLTGVLGIAGVGLALFLMGPGVSGQDKEPGVKVRGQLPPLYKKLGLAEDQVQRIYKIQGEYRPKIQQLERQIKKLRGEERREMAKVLTDDQRAKLRKLIEDRIGEPPAEPKKQ